MALPRPRLPTAACVVAVLLTTVCRGAPVRHFIDWSDLNVARHYPRYSDVKAGVDAGGGRRVISVSKDGAGDATTVQGAVDMVPGGNTERVKIMISPGVYREKVIVPKSKPFISFIGDGTSATVISFHLRASDQFSNGETVGTYDSATVAVESDFFCANGITFENIDALLREQQKSRAVFDSELGELNIYRSGSAPPTVEGSRTVFGSLFGPVGFGESQGFRRAADTRLSDEEMRSHPDYSSYYYWNPKLNPRMPPPAISREDWRARQRFHGGISSYGGIGDHRGRTEFVDATDFSGSSLFSLQPGFPKHAEQDEMVEPNGSLQQKNINFNILNFCNHF